MEDGEGKGKREGRSVRQRQQREITRDGESKGDCSKGSCWGQLMPHLDFLSKIEVKVTY